MHEDNGQPLEHVYRKRETLSASPGIRTAAWLAGVILLAVAIVATSPHQRRKRIVAVARAVAQQAEDTNAEPPGIVLHDSDTPGRIHGRLVGRAHIEETEREDHPNWRTVYDGKVYHIGYHYVIRADGVVERGRPDNCLGTHCRTHNDWIGICMIGAFSTNRAWWPARPTHAQMVSLIALCERLMSRYHISTTYVKRHRDLNMTWCPGDRFPYRFVLSVLKDYERYHPETRTPHNRVVSTAIPKPGERRNYAPYLTRLSAGSVTHRSAAIPFN